MALLLHGILGSRKNWSTIGRRLAQAHPDWSFIAVDLRGHGDSHDVEPFHTVDACARDVIDLVMELELDVELVIGHSFGGKIALEVARQGLPGLKQVACLDSSPSLMTPDTTSVVDSVIRAARAAPMPVSNRLAMVPHFESLGFSRSIGAWMTTNLRRGDDGFVWRFDLDIVETLLDDYRDQTYWSYLESSGRAVPTLWVLAGRSDWWKGDTYQRLESLVNAQVRVLPESGHWVHVDDPDGLLAVLSEALNSL